MILNKLYKILIIPLLIVMVFAFGINVSAEVNSKWTSGDLIFFDAATDIFSIRNDTDGVKIFDDLNLTFGTDNNATIEYDEDGTDKLILTASGGFTLAGALGITGNILMATTSKIQFHDTGLYINASGDGALVISSDGTIAVGATTSYTLTSPAVKFIATTSVIHQYDAASYVTQTVSDAGLVTVTVTGDSAGSYEIVTDDTTIVLDAATAISLEAGAGTYGFSATTFDVGALTITNVGTITATNAAGPTVINLAATATVPTLCPNRAEVDTGIGWQSDVLHVVLGGVDEYNFAAAAFITSASDGAALGTATYMWSDLFLAEGAVINFNAGNVTLTHTAGLLTMVGGALTMGASGTPSGDFTLWGTTALYKVWFDVNGDTNGAWYFGADDYGLDVNMYGATAGCSFLWDQSEDQLVVTQTNAATTGTEKTLVISQTHTDIGASAEAFSSTLTTNVAGGTYQNAIFGKIDYQTAGKVTGLAGVICAELTMAGGAVSQGTYATFEAEINLPASYSSSVPISFFRMSTWGNQNAQFDDYGYLFDITGVTTGANDFFYLSDVTLTKVDGFLKIRVLDVTYYIPITTVQTGGD